MKGTKKRVAVISISSKSIVFHRSCVHNLVTEKPYKGVERADFPIRRLLSIIYIYRVINERGEKIICSFLP